MSNNFFWNASKRDKLHFLRLKEPYSIHLSLEEINWQGMNYLNREPISSMHDPLWEGIDPKH